MNKTKIDWCDSTWNPVTGCLHGCEYCYARGIAKRFGGWTWVVDGDADTLHDTVLKCDSPIRELDEPLTIWRENAKTGKFTKAPYPYDFIPTFHRYRLSDYIGKQGRNIFVCSMADLFGEWVPPEWRLEVFETCRKATQHNYLFLTKNPAMYANLDKKGILPSDSNMWFGASVTTPYDPFPHNGKKKHNLFLSIEPILADFGVPCSNALKDIKWVIIGAETGRRKDKVVPKREWIENIENVCRTAGVPIFMKSSLADIWGEPLIQEFPPELDRGFRRTVER